MKVPASIQLALCGLVCIALTLASWQYAVSLEEASIRKGTQEIAEAFVQDAGITFNYTQDNLLRAVERLTTNDNLTADFIELEAKLFLKDTPALTSFVWINSKNVIEWISPPQFQSAWLGRDLGAAPYFATYIDEVRARGLNLCLGVFFSENEKLNFGLHAPMSIDGQYLGLVGGEFDASRFFQLDQSLFDNVHIIVTSGDTEVFRQGGSDFDAANPFYFKTIGTVGNAAFEFEVIPTDAYIASHRTRLPVGILVFGLLLTVLTLWCHYQFIVISRTSEKLLRQSMALSQTADAMFIHDNDLNIIDFNQAALDMFGYSSDELRSLPIANLSDDSIASGATTSAWQTFTKTAEAPARFMPCRTKSGEIITLSISNAPLRDDNGEAIGIVSMARDITDQLINSHKVKVSERQLAEAQHVAQIGSWERDLKTEKIEWSPQIYRLLEVQNTTDPLTLEQILPKIHEEDRDIFLSKLRVTPDSEERSECTVRLLKKEGPTKHVHVISTIFFDDDGVPIRRTGTAQDVTQKHELEEQLRHSERLKSLGQLTGGVAHDFNNILGIISNTARIIEMDADEPTQPRSKENIERILKAVGRAAELTNQLLSFSRKQSLSPRNIDTKSFIEELAVILRRTLGDGITIRSNVETDSWAVYADEPQLNNAILNLALNARDAMNGSGLMTLDVKNIDFATQADTSSQDIRPGDYISIAVSDNGVGMTEDVIEKAFEPFFTTKGVGEGSGLGLSMVYGFANQSGGSAVIETEATLGTTVTLYIPAIKDHAPKSPDGRAKMAMPRSDQRTLLIVEDQIDLKNVTGEIIQRLGFKTFLAGDGNEARSIASATPHIDVALLDVVLPGDLNGIELAPLLRQSHPEMKIVFTTGYASESVLSRLETIEHNGVYKKPLDVDALMMMLNELFE